MSIFASEFSKMLSNQEDFGLGLKSSIVSIPTGFELMDLSNASKNPENGKVSMGWREGHIISIVGPTGSGKSTLAQILSAAIVRPFKNGSLHIFDAEHAYDLNRSKILYAAGNPALFRDFDEKNLDRKVFLWNENIYLDHIRSYIANLHDLKQSHREELMETFEDPNGDKVEVMAPSVVILDSLASIFSKVRMSGMESAKDAENGDSNAAGMQTAKENNAFFAKILNMLFASNIILVVCNHITTAISMDPRGTPQKSKFPWLKPDEAIKGGSGFWYFSDLFMRIDRGKLITDDERYHVRAHVNRVQIMKSRGHDSGISYPMVFNYTDGGIYDDVLSNAEYLIENGLIHTGKSCSIEGSDEKFSLAQLKAKTKAEPAFAEIIANKVYDLFDERMASSTQDVQQSVDDLNKIKE